jgi:hypothetical protein
MLTTHRQTDKQTYKHSQPSPTETAERRDIIGHDVDVSLGLSSFSPRHIFSPTTGGGNIPQKPATSLCIKQRSIMLHQKGFFSRKYKKCFMLNIRVYVIDIC